MFDPELKQKSQIIRISNFNWYFDISHFLENFPLFGFLTVFIWINQFF